MKPTDTKNSKYYHKVVDCQFACPAHTPVPEYIRLIAQGKYTQSYMLNWSSNVFPGILGRTCDRPCEPACRRGRLEGEGEGAQEPVAICRLKRVSADHKDEAEVKALMPEIPKKKNGKRIAFIGAGPASLTVIRDLMPLGYECTLYDNQERAGGMMRSQIPAFRLPDEVLDEEVGYVLDMGVEAHFGTWISSMKKMLDQDYDAIFVGTGAPQGRDLNIPGRAQGDPNIHVGVDWLASVAFEHTKSIGKRVLVLGGGNTAMDCCRTARRLSGEGADVRIVVRSPQKDMKASAWEIEDTLNEDIPIFENHVPKEFVITNGKLTGMMFEKVEAVYDENGKRSLVPLEGEDPVFMACDDVLIAIGQDNAFPWIERDLGLEFGKWDLPVLDSETFQSTLPNVFFGGDAALGPENIITAVAQGHKVAISIDRFCMGGDLKDRPAAYTNLISQKMGVHEWLYENDISNDDRFKVPHVEKDKALSSLKLEVEMGFDETEAYAEAMRCLNCDAQTVFTEAKCIECDACVDICPTSCITFTQNGEEEELRLRLKVPALNKDQALLISGDLPNKTGRIMVKDEDLCLHCSLCAERCPTAAWDMQKFEYEVAKAYDKKGAV